jgi:hypothetical protein
VPRADQAHLYRGSISPRCTSGLRIFDVADQLVPCEMGYSEPVFGGPSSPSNDDDVDNRGLIYLADRNVGFDILELRH